ncbi:MAG: hypothetical protein KM296_00030 [Brockia lithotrophica]|nr:hypothetical protein [Brockia lithotrophica]
MSLRFEYDPESRVLRVTGNTFPLKEILKEYGGRWNPETKAWEFTNLDPERARELQDELSALAAEHDAKKESPPREERPPREEKPTADTPIMGIAKYDKGDYELNGLYVVGRESNGKPAVVQTKDFSKIKLVSRGFDFFFWAPVKQVKIETLFQELKRLGDLEPEHFKDQAENS